MSNNSQDCGTEIPKIVELKFPRLCFYAVMFNCYIFFIHLILLTKIIAMERTRSIKTQSQPWEGRIITVILRLHLNIIILLIATF